MSAEAVVQVKAVGASSAEAVVWRMRGELRVTVLVKGTFAFQPDAPMRVSAPEEIVRAEVHHGKNPARSVRLTSDLAPFLPAADVVLTGHACAPEDETALGMSVRLAVYRDRALLDKSINVLCSTEDGGDVPFETMPLVYEKAYGGIGFADNPYGVGVASQADKAPNLVDPVDPQKVACFAPISRGWPNRKRLLGKTERRALEGPVCEIPDGFNFSYFQAAPFDQQIAYLQGNEWIVLEGMHATHTQITSCLPSAIGRARVFGLGDGGQGRALALTADTLRIDADTLTCTVVWRGSFPVRDAETLGRLVIHAGVDTAEKVLEWPPPPEVAAPAGGTPSTPPPAMAPRSAAPVSATPVSATPVSATPVSVAPVSVTPASATLASASTGSASTGSASTGSASTGSASTGSASTGSASPGGAGSASATLASAGTATGKPAGGHARPSWDRTVELGDNTDPRARPAVPFRKGPVNLPPPKAPAPPSPRRDLSDTFATSEIVEAEDSPPTLPFTTGAAFPALAPEPEPEAPLSPARAGAAAQPSPRREMAPPPLPVARPHVTPMAERTLQLEDEGTSARPTIPFPDRFQALAQQLAALSPLNAPGATPLPVTTPVPTTTPFPSAGLPPSGLPTYERAPTGLPISGLPISETPVPGLPTSGLPTSGLPTSDSPGAEPASDGPSAIRASFEAARAKRSGAKDEIVPLQHDASLAATVVGWGDSPSRCALTVIAKATCDLVPDGPAALRGEAEALSGDRSTAGPRGMLCVYPSDLSPFKVRADVLLVGHAQAPAGGAAEVTVGFKFGAEESGFDRRLLVFGERSWQRVGPALKPSEPAVFLRMPLSYDHAFGGRGHATNPLGLGFESARNAPPPPPKNKPSPKTSAAKKPALLPHLEDPNDRLRAPQQTPKPASFGPLPRTARDDKPSRSLADAYDWTRHQAAPPEQRLPFLRGDEPFEILGVHPKLPVLKGALPGVSVRCRAERHGGAKEEIPMRLDTAFFDLDLGTLTLVWRGTIPVSDEREPDVSSVRLALGPIDDDSPLP
ncbi:MAG: DUF2169 domain-containing protein [Polyangiaceae bacterium]